MQVYVNVERDFYETSAQVNGVVTVGTRDRVRAASLRLAFSGDEFVRLTKYVPDPIHRREIEERADRARARGDQPVLETVHNVPKQHVTKQSFYKTEQTIATFQNKYLEPGIHKFPFSFVLGEGIPNSFDKTWGKLIQDRPENEAIISYNLTARLMSETDDMIGRQAIKYLTVNNRLL